MSTPDNTELQALIDIATPGPWEYDDDGEGNITVRAGEARTDGQGGYPWRYQSTDMIFEREVEDWDDMNDDLDSTQTRSDAKFIALTPDIAAELIAVRADRERIIDGVKTALTDMHYLANHSEGPNKDYDQGYHHAIEAFDQTLTALLNGTENQE